MSEEAATMEQLVTQMTDGEDQQQSLEEESDDWDSDWSLECENRPAVLSWLPAFKHYKHRAYVRLEYGHVKMLQKKEANKSRLWHLIEKSLPPLLERRYHSVNMMQLIKDDIEFQYFFQTVAVWFVSMNKSLGIQYLNSIQTVHYKAIKQYDENADVQVFADKYVGTPCQKEVENWQVAVDKIVATMEATRSMEISPQSTDIESKTNHFLLAPCVIIQLPWCTTLLHQWLTAALAEVLIFEKESLELRHWPLPSELESCATELLLLLKRLKERILLGFMIVCQQVTLYPQVDARHPSLIFDHVVLPSVLTLGFLTSGEAATVLQSIKNMAWSKSEAFEGLLKRVYLTKDSYCIHPKLQDFYQNMYNHPMYWLGDCKPPFGDKDKHCNIEEIIQILQSATQETTHYENSFEDIIWSNIISDEKQQEFYLTGKNRMDLILNTVNDLIVENPTRPFPDSAWTKCMEIFENEETEKLLGDIPMHLLNADVSSYTQKIAVCCMIYEYIFNELTGYEVEESVLARVVNLSYDVLEREYAIQIISFIGDVVKFTPVADKIDKKMIPMSVKSICEILQNVKLNGESVNREWVWSQFSLEWRKPVSLEERTVKYNIKFPELVKKYENRIGRIVFNIAFKCFDIYENGGDIFPYWQYIQYVVPCYIAVYHRFIKDPDDKFNKNILSNYIKLLHNILQFYEKSYENWHINIKSRKVPDDPSSPKCNTITSQQSFEMLFVVNYYRDLLNFMLNSHVGHVDPICQENHRFQSIVFGFVHWPITTLENVDAIFSLRHNVMTWIDNVLQTFKDLYHICLKAWDFPLPGESHKNKKLEYLYYTDSIIYTLENTFMKCLGHLQGHKIGEQAFELSESIKASGKQMYYVRFNLRLIMSEPDPIAALVNMLAEMMRLKLKENYKQLKEFKQLIGPCKLKFVEHFPNEPLLLKLASLLYLNNKFEDLDRLLPLFDIEDAINCCRQGQATCSKAKETSSDKKKVQAHVKKCRNCPRTEQKKGSFIVCEKCHKDKYPDVNFYCSKACKYAKWKEEHMAEHLEFDLGLADFSHLNLGQ